MDSVLLAIDIGTTNVKCVVFTKNAMPIGEAVSEYQTHSLGNNQVEQCAQDWWEGTKSAIQKALAQSSIPASRVTQIAVSSQAPTMLPVNKAGIPLSGALIWMDRRSEPQCQQISEQFSPDTIFKITGNTIDPFYTLSELLWFKQTDPRAYEQTYCILQANGYVNYCLTGEFSLDEVHASITQGYDITRHTWSDDILDGLGISKSIFPRVYKSYEVIGGVSPAASAQTGLSPGTPVLAGTVDGAAAAIEGGVSQHGTAVEMSGTSSVLLIDSGYPHTTQKLTYMYSAIPNHHLLLGCISTTGGALKWFRDSLYIPNTANVYQMMSEEVENEAANPTDLIFLPYLAGERAPIWDSNAKGIFAGITFQTSRADMLRAIMEGASFTLKDNATEAQKAGAHINKMRAVGGSTNSDIWMRIKASVMGMPIEIPKSNLGAPGGLMAIMSYALGEASSIQEAADSMFEIDRTVEPVREWVPHYEDQFGIFKDIYLHTKEDCRRLGQYKISHQK